MSDLSFIGREFNIREENTDGSIIQLAIKNGRVVSVDQVENGLACGCRCPDCDGILIAKNRGEIKVHHFAHESGQICETSQETALHLLAKEVLIEQKAILLPSPHNGNVQRFDAAAAEVTQYLLDGGIFDQMLNLFEMIKNYLLSSELPMQSMTQRFGKYAFAV